MSRRKRLLLFGAAALAIVELAWLLAFEWAASSGRLERWVNRRPDKFVLRFADADSWLPFHLRVEKLELAGQSPRWQWQAETDSASAWLSPLPLLARRLVFESISAQGLSVRARRRAGSPEEADALAGRVPHIGSFPHFSDKPDGPPRATRAWSYEFPRLRAEEVREVWIEELHFTGRLEAHGGFAMRRRSEAQVFSSNVRIARGRVLLDGEPLLAELSGTVDGAIERYPYRQKRGLAVFDHVVASAECRGELQDGELLRRYLQRAPWIGFDEASAPFVARAELARGEILPGTRLEMDRPRRVVSMFGFEASGEARLLFDVVRDPDGPRANLALDFREYEIRRSGTEKPDIAGRGLSFLATSREVGLSGLPADTRIAIDLGAAKFLDLSTLSALFPTSAGVEILGGGGTVEGRLVGDLAANSAQGTLAMQLDGVHTRFSGLSSSGRVTLEAPLRSEDLAGRVFRLDGSRVRFSDFGIAGAGETAPPDVAGWWADVVLPHARIDLSSPGILEGGFAMRMRDSVPLVSFYSARKDLPGWVENLLSVPDVEATGEFRWRRGELEVRDLESALRQAHIRARLSLARNRRQGQMLLEWKRVAIGVGLEGAGRRIHLLGAREWFENPVTPGAEPQKN